MSISQVSLTLPMQPLPLSQCFVNRKGGGRHESEAYAAWKRAADAHLVKFHLYTLGTPNRPTIPGKVKVEVFIQRPDSRRRDLDNCLKATLDLLTRNYVIADDSEIVDLRVSWCGLLTGQGTVIEVESVSAKAEAA